MWRVKADATPWLNVRAGRGATFPKVGQFTPLQIIDVTAVVDGWATVALFPPHVALYVNAAYIEKVPDGEQPPEPTTKRNRLGWHILPGAPRSFIDMLGRLHMAGRPVPFVTLVYVNGAAAFTAAEIKAVSPSTTICARDLRGGDYQGGDIGGWNNATREHGRAYFETNKHLITDDMRNADFIQFRDVNETGEGTGINAWWQGMLDGADAMGVKLGVYQFSYGNPADLAFWRWDSTVDLLTRVKRDGHALCLHEYADHDDWTNDWTILRHRRIYPLLPEELRDIKLWVTECGESYLAPGTPNNRSADRYASRLASLQQSLADSPGDADVALWTLGNGGDSRWNADRLEHILATYEALVTA